MITDKNDRDENVALNYTNNPFTVSKQKVSKREVSPSTCLVNYKQ